MAVATERKRRMRAHSRLAAEKAYRLIIQTSRTVITSAAMVTIDVPFENADSRSRFSSRSK